MTGGGKPLITWFDHMCGLIGAAAIIVVLCMLVR